MTLRAPPAIDLKSACSSRYPRFCSNRYRIELESRQHYSQDVVCVDRTISETADNSANPGKERHMQKAPQILILLARRRDQHFYIDEYFGEESSKLKKRDLRI